MLKQNLEEQGPAPILAALAQLRPADEAAAEEVRKAEGYFTEHAERMDYPTFIAMKLPIGSGAIESACKTLIEEREKGAGMRWTKVGAQSVATLRAAQIRPLGSILADASPAAPASGVPPLLNQGCYELRYTKAGSLTP